MGKPRQGHRCPLRPHHLPAPERASCSKVSPPHKFGKGGGLVSKEHRFCHLETVPAFPSFWNKSLLVQSSPLHLTELL